MSVRVHPTHLMEGGRCVGCLAEPWMPLAAYRCDGLQGLNAGPLRDRVRAHIRAHDDGSGAVPLCWSKPDTSGEITPRILDHARTLCDLRGGASNSTLPTLRDYAREVGVPYDSLRRAVKS